ncbi:hypothetical protein SAMN06295885_0193 [Rathayibacter oskolensis]|uniref:Uncharacterized protein n=1 Tax=Rathayibacter oskolensis TaxID=1891671 RepID=A0A1X7MUK7_9MICO|nr:hypothetical protein [Rathayibacter oskolensis]SMH28535.1 hypothetical protein SAMN06295885_0193 [Rathayibacter oskolensis]
MSDRRGDGEEGTLLALVRAAEHGPATLRAVRARIQRAHQLSASYMGVGFVGMGVLLTVRGIVSFVWGVNAGAVGALTAAAWVLVLLGFSVAVAVAIRRRGDLPRPLFAGIVAIDVVALGMEFADVALSDSAPFYYPSVCIGVAATALGVVSFHPLSRTTAAIVVLIATSAAVVLLQVVLLPDRPTYPSNNILTALAPLAVCAVILSTLDDHVHRKLDRTLIDSMIDAPATGPGSLAASELSRVDARVEELLEEVTRHPGSAPLDPALGERGRILGDELRGVLALSRDRTWLRIAVEESSHLSDAVSIDDPAGLAGVLDASARGRLLSLLWLLTAPAAVVRPEIELGFAPGPPGPAAVGITVTARGARPRDLDQAIWGILGELGSSRVVVHPGGTAVHLDHHLARKPAP